MKYTDRQRAAALAVVKAAGGNVTPAVAHEAGIPRATLQRWAANGLPKLGQEKKEAIDTLAAMWDRIASKAGALAEATLDAFDGCPDKRMLQQYTTTSAIATDKRQLLTGGATERHAHVFDWAGAIGISEAGPGGDYPASRNGQGFGDGAKVGKNGAGRGG